MSKSVGYVAYLRVRTKPEKRAEFLRLVAELRANVRKHESTTLFYEILQGSHENEFVFFEGFVDEAAQQAHEKAAYHVAMSTAGWACLDGNPVIEFMKPAV
jgi:quinol monooxygenase YgiN